MIKKVYLYGIEYCGDELVTSDIVAQITGLSKRTIEGMSSRREIPMYKFGLRANRYKIREILDWVERRKVP